MYEPRDSLERRYLDGGGKYGKAARRFRIAGLCCLGVGTLGVGTGCLGGLFIGSAAGVFFLLGIPLIPIGLILTLIGSMGAIARYQADQIAPVGKDVVNYMAVGTQEGVKTATKALAEGLREGLAGQPLIGISTGANAAAAPVVRCPKCHAANQAGSKFCDQCGAPLTLACKNCGAENQADSRYCDQCGKSLA